MHMEESKLLDPMEQKIECNLPLNLSFVQILEVRMQCVVVDVHTDQSLQKKKKTN